MAANRDEFHARASRAAAPWPEHPTVIAGTDSVAGGTWLGVTRQGRYAFLTNYRDPAAFIPDAPSRGQLVSGYLTGSDRPEEYAQAIRSEEHTSELQSLMRISYAVFCLKKKKKIQPLTTRTAMHQIYHDASI